jgi:putative tricarboxylic transport membrane protein
VKAWLRRTGADFWSSLFLLLLSGAVINEAFNLELGTPRNPGSGFMIFGAAAALGLFALRQFIVALLSPASSKESAADPIHWGRIVCVVLAVLAYILLLEPVGFLLCTFLLLTFLFQILEPGHWVRRTIGAALTSFLSYTIFAKAMSLSLPKGLITFF